MSVRPITDTLRQIAGGEFIDKSSDMMAELVRAVDEQGGQGSITLKITVKRATANGAMTVTGKATLSKPAEAPMEALLFVTPEGNLVPDNPNQQKLNLKTVDVPAAPLKMANAQ